MGTESQQCVDELLKKLVKIEDLLTKFQDSDKRENNLISNSRELIYSTQIYIDNNKSIIPGYTLKKVSDALKKLENFVDKPQKTNLQFKFKTKSSSSTPQKKIEESKNVDTIQDKTDETNKSIINDLVSTAFFGFKDETDQQLQLLDVDAKDVSLINLIDCQVEIFGNASTVYIRELKNTKVTVCLAARSITITNCSNCKFKLVCQQVRIDSSMSCILEVFSTTGSMLESSKELTFRCLEINNLPTKAQEVFSKSTFKDNQNNWKSVNDFDCLCNSTASNNYKIILE